MCPPREFAPTPFASRVRPLRRRPLTVSQQIAQPHFFSAALAHPDGHEVTLTRDGDTFIERGKATGSSEENLIHQEAGHCASVVFELRLSQLRQQGFRLLPPALATPSSPTLVRGNAAAALAAAIRPRCPPLARLIEAQTRRLLTNTPSNRLAALQAEEPWADILLESGDEGQDAIYESRHLYNDNWPGTDLSFVDFFEPVTALPHDEKLYVWSADYDYVTLYDAVFARYQSESPALARNAKPQQFNTAAAHQLRMLLGSPTAARVASIRLLVHGDIEPFASVLTDTRAGQLVTHLVLAPDAPGMAPARLPNSLFSWLQGVSCPAKDLHAVFGADVYQSVKQTTIRRCGETPLVDALTCLSSSFPSLEHVGLWFEHDTLSDDDINDVANHPLLPRLLSLDLQAGGAWWPALSARAARFAHLCDLFLPRFLPDDRAGQTEERPINITPVAPDRRGLVAFDIETFGWPSY